MRSGSHQALDVSRLGEVPGGLRYVPGFLDPEAQRTLVSALRAVIAEAPLFQPRMPRTGKPFSVKMTNCGPLGWVSDHDRISLSAGASRDRPTVATDAGNRA